MLLLAVLSSQFKFSKFLLSSSFIAIIVAVIVSGSRLFLVLTIVMFISGLAVSVYMKSKVFIKMLALLCFMGISVGALSSINVISQAIFVFQTRISDAERTEGNEGTSRRITDQFSHPISALDLDMPFWGYGIGAATNVGTKLLGKKPLSLGESEWPRTTNEFGPVGGLLYVLLRLSIMTIVLKFSIKSLALFKNPSGIILSFAVLPIVVFGNMGISSTSGFVAFFTGITLCTAIRRRNGSAERLFV